MRKSEATAEVFWTAFKVLPRKDQQTVLRRVLGDQKLRRDLLELAIIESRRSEPARPLRESMMDARRRK